jgi:hypothetical protein
LLVLSISEFAQTKVIVAFQVENASQFGYDPFDKGAWLELRHRFSEFKKLEKVEGFIALSPSNAKKHYVGDGTHLSGALGARYWFKDRFFVIGGVNFSADRNSQYSKVAVRGSLGAGVKFSDWTVTGSVFAPPAGLVSDPNLCKGATLLLEYERPIFGPIGFYAAGQVTAASFSQTGEPGTRFTGVIPKGRLGVMLSF